MMDRYSMASIRRKQMMYWYIGFLFLWSLAIALMPLGSAIKEDTMLMIYCSGVGFWIGAAGTIFVALEINRCRKNSYRFNETNNDRKQFGLVHFFQNKEAIVMDVMMFISIIGFIMAEICTSELLVLFVFLAMLVFSFGMHCMLNGINYRYIKYEVRREEES